MHLNPKVIRRMGGTVVGKVSFECMTPRIKNEVLKSLRRGYSSATGTADLYYTLATEAAKHPRLSFSKQSTWRRSIGVTGITKEMAEGLSIWWQADRMAYRLESPDEWNQRMKHPYTRDPLTAEPNWTKALKHPMHTFYVDFVSAKDESMLDVITEEAKKSPTYADTLAKAIELVETGATVPVEVV